jgi:predicted secreted hydrolase
MKFVYRVITRVFFKLACRAARRGWFKPTLWLSHVAVWGSDRFYACQRRAGK